MTSGPDNKTLAEHGIARGLASASQRHPWRASTPQIHRFHESLASSIAHPQALVGTFAQLAFCVLALGLLPSENLSAKQGFGIPPLPPPQTVKLKDGRQATIAWEAFGTQQINVYRSRRDGQLYMNLTKYDALHEDIRAAVEAAAAAAGANDTTKNIVMNSFKGSPRHPPYDDRNPLCFPLRYGVGRNTLTGERVTVAIATVSPECLRDIDDAGQDIESRNEAIYLAAAQINAAREMAAAAREAQAAADRARDAVRDLKFSLGL
jgi:hypothetical protein